MRHPLTTILAVVSVTSALWFLTLAQLSGPTHYTSIPAHSTRTLSGPAHEQHRSHSPPMTGDRSHRDRHWRA
jgi:hypothetical protein